MSVLGASSELGDRIGEARTRWENAEGEGVRRMRPWAARMLDAAATSLSCGLQAQAENLLARVEARFPKDVEGPRQIAFQVAWKSDGLPRTPSTEREKTLWRKVRSLRSARRPYDGAQHPERRGLAWGPYNRASAVVETLELAARIDPLWVDDFIERERAAGAIDHLLGIAN